MKRSFRGTERVNRKQAFHALRWFQRWTLKNAGNSNCSTRFATLVRVKNVANGSWVNSRLWCSATSKDVRKGWWGGVKPPHLAWYFTKTLSPAQRRLIAFTYFFLLICQLNANTTEWICMQISRNVANGPKTNN